MLLVLATGAAAAQERPALRRAPVVPLKPVGAPMAVASVTVPDGVVAEQGFQLVVRLENVPGTRISAEPAPYTTGPGYFKQNPAVAVGPVQVASNGTATISMPGWFTLGPRCPTKMESG